MKYNMHYRRFRHFGKDKVTMDFAFFAIAFNIKKMAAKAKKQGDMPIKGGHNVPSVTFLYAYWGLAEALQNRNHKNCRITIYLSKSLNAKRKKEDVPILTHPLFNFSECPILVIMVIYSATSIA